jgi:hypothetical protein
MNLENLEYIHVHKFNTDYYINGLNVMLDAWMILTGLFSSLILHVREKRDNLPS